MKKIIMTVLLLSSCLAWADKIDDQIAKIGKFFETMESTNAQIGRTLVWLQFSKMLAQSPAFQRATGKARTSDISNEYNTFLRSMNDLSLKIWGGSDGKDATLDETARLMARLEGVLLTSNEKATSGEDA
ncbi:MAG: hypothetical protein WCG27_09470, partial [Pseudomonadota bacterium]